LSNEFEVDMRIREDTWLANIFGHPVYRIFTDSVEDFGKKDDISRQVSENTNNQSSAFFYTKVGTEKVYSVRNLSTAGLYVVDVNISLRVTSDKVRIPSSLSGISVAEIRPEQYQAVLDIASTCFRYSRFHQDPFCEISIANQIKHDWVLNYIRGNRGECLFVASLDGKPAGFLAVLATDIDGKKVYTVDLIGVHNLLKGRGAGQALMARFVDQYKDQCDYLQVGTQIVNIPSMRLYQKFGFSINQSQYVMHLHVRDGRPIQ